MNTYLKAVTLIYQESLSLGGISHFLCVLGHQGVEKGIVLLGDHPYRKTGEKTRKSTPAPDPPGPQREASAAEDKLFTQGAITLTA